MSDVIYDFSMEMKEKLSYTSEKPNSGAFFTMFRRLIIF
jgi:hypothetical protein